MVKIFAFFLLISFSAFAQDTTITIRGRAVIMEGVAPSATVPGAPLNVSAVAGNGAATISFNAPASNGGSAITFYTVTSSPGNVSVAGASSPINVIGLTNNTSYTFTVRATNAVGASVASSASNSVTPLAAATIPNPPTLLNATGGNSLASITFTPPISNGGATITSYSVTSSPGNITQTGAGSPITVSTLTNGTAYNFTARAINSVGTSVASVASNTVTPFTVPNAPTGVSAVAGNASATVSFTAPVSNGGSVITSYTATSSPGSLTQTGASSPLTVGGLTNNTAYTFTTRATNAAGLSVASAASNSVTPSSAIASIPGNYTFTSTGGNTSSGVYNTAGELKRTLFSGEQLAAATYTRFWDGKDNDGNTIGYTGHSVKVLTNNVTYEWEGARIGNTSTALTGDTKHRMFEPAVAMAITGSTAYVAGGYNEAWPAQYKFNLATPQVKTWVGRLRKTDQASDFVVTDGTRVYWAGYDPLEVNETFVFSTNVSNDALVDFGVNGTTATMMWGGDYSAISYKNMASAHISGMAIQQAGSYLFISRSGQNEIQVVNKTTGVLVRTITLTGAGRLGIDIAGFLWAGRSIGTLEKYTINGDGTITTTGVTISMTNIGGFGFSPDGTTISVCDVNNQNVKSFSTSTGVASWTLGQTGGYLTNATVNNDKFYFKDLRVERLTYLVYAPDGSFWVGDPGNCRTQHYAANRTFIDRIMFMPNTYKTSVDKSNPTRLYADFMEFEINYSLPLATSWTLKNNWQGNFTSSYNIFSKVFNPITFSNGKVYSMVQIDAVQYPVIELVANGVIRYTGITLGQRAFLGFDGSKMQPTVGANVIWNRYPLTGYDGSNNPLWSATPEVLATVPYNINDPMPGNNMYEHPITASNKIMLFNASRVDSANAQDYHLGVVNRGGTGWLWKTAKGTLNSYSGPFPEDGFFDNGNGVEVGNRAGGAGLILGDNIFWGYHGEFWKQSQTNKWNHIDANTGLFVGQFGVLTKDFPNVEGFAGGAGNVFEGTVITVNDTTYLYHNDEGVNNGVHRWRINGLSTISTQIATFPSTVAIDTLEGIDLMTGIDWGLTTLPNNYNGWTRFPVADGFTGGIWQVTTGVKAYDKLKRPDLYLMYNKGINNANYAERTLNNSNALTTWALTGSINWDGNVRTQAQLKAGSYLEVLDNTNKVIARLDLRQRTVGDELDVRGNDKVILTPFTFDANFKNQAIEISKSGSTLTFKFGNSTQTTTVLAETGADITRPAKLRLYFFTNADGAGDANDRIISIRDFRFKSNQAL